SAVPPAPTVLDALIQHQVPVVAVGKVGQIFAGRGISASYESKSNQAGIEQTIALLSELSHGLIFTNLVDFDMLFGHRRDAAGYARAIQEFDRSLPRIIAGLLPGDLLLLTADHGNDPTFRVTDHTRDFVPLLAYGRSFASGRDLGVLKTFADVAATLASLFGLDWAGPGERFLEELQA